MSTAIEFRSLTPPVYHYLKELMIINLAGPLAVARLLKKPFRQGGAGKDLRDCVNEAFRVLSDTKVVNSYFNYVIEEARFFVSNPKTWKCINAIANDLIKYKKLSKKQGKEIYYAEIFN